MSRGLVERVMSSARRRPRTAPAAVGALVGALAGCGDNFALRDAPVVDVAAAPSIDAVLATVLDAVPSDAALIDASPFDAPPGVPDLQFVANQMAGTVVFDRHTFFADDCEVVEQCVGGAGARLLLRFDTVTANRGTGDLVVGVPPPDGESNDQFVWSACHKHHHYNNFIQYQLIDSAGNVTAARKQSFCLEDGEQVQIGATPTGYSCRNQGISRGWADIYTRYTPCQWIDVTGLPSGAYTLHAEVNPLHTLVESSFDNNVFTVAVKL